MVAPGYAQEELKQLVDRLLAPPKIETRAGFTAKVLVPPGQFYDPLFIVARDDAIWVSDDGPELKVSEAVSYSRLTRREKSLCWRGLANCCR
jgi:hypothetical protein